MYQQSEKHLLNSNISSTCPQNMVNFGPLMAEIGSLVCGTLANFNGFCVLASLLQRRCSTEANQTARYLAVCWASTLYVHFRGLLPRNGVLPGAKFTLLPILALSYIGSVTALHSSSGRQPNFVAWYTQLNYGTFTECATYIQLSGHHIGNRPTF